MVNSAFLAHGDIHHDELWRSYLFNLYPETNIFFKNKKMEKFLILFLKASAFFVQNDELRNR